MTLRQAINWKQDASLFPPKEMYLFSHDDRGKNIAFKQLSESVQRRKQIDNMQIIQNLPKTQEHGFPIVQPYTGSLDFTYVSFADRKKYDGKRWCWAFFFMTVALMFQHGISWNT